MAESGFKVLVDELTVHKAVRQLTHPVTGEPTGWQQGAGETWFLDEVIPASQMNPEWAEALESGDENNPLYADLSKKLEASSDEPAINEAYRMGLPFEGYDDMEEDDILAAMRVLPSPAVMRIKDWERQKGADARESIALFNIGFGEAPDDRNTGRIGQAEDEETDDNKPVRAMSTRSLDLESGEFQYGEGITGSGDPPLAPGTRALQEESDDDSALPSESDASESKLTQASRATSSSDSGDDGKSKRAGRRPRPTARKQPAADKDTKDKGTVTPTSGSSSS